MCVFLGFLWLLCDSISHRIIFSLISLFRTFNNIFQIFSQALESCFIFTSKTCPVILAALIGRFDLLLVEITKVAKVIATLLSNFCFYNFALFFGSSLCGCNWLIEIVGPSILVISLFLFLRHNWGLIHCRLIKVVRPAIIFWHDLVLGYRL